MNKNNNIYRRQMKNNDQTVSFWRRLIRFFKSLLNIFKSKKNDKDLKNYKNINYNPYKNDKKFKKDNTKSNNKNNKRIKEIIGVVDCVNIQYSYIIIEGTIRTPNHDNDVCVYNKDLKGALHGDVVKVEVFNETIRNHNLGSVIQILTRANHEYVGSIKKINNKMVFIANNRHIFTPIAINEIINQPLPLRAKIKITEFSNDNINMPKGQVLDIFGSLGEHETEIKTIHEEFNLPIDFSSELIKNVNKINGDITDEEINRRLDYRSIFTITIDPETSKDFDDAISLQYLAPGHYEVGVHIADVSYYVKEESIIDKEAYKRNTSVYLIDRTIPMLPERLCNDLCSINPDVDRLAMSVIFDIDGQGNVYDKWIGETVIHSFKRMTYNEAQSAINNKDDVLHKPLSIFNIIAKNLRLQRLNNGAIDFVSTDIDFNVNNDDIKSLNIEKSEVSDSHHLIEEFMLLANKTVATYVAEEIKPNSNKKPVFLYRIHDIPDESKIADFEKMIKQFGYENQFTKETLRDDLNKFFNDIQGKNEENILRTLAIRIMPKAVYSTQPVQHFGLAFKHYSHFTSPIRRYPDLIVHRLLKKYLNKQYIYESLDYDTKCLYAIDREKVAADSERASIKFKQLEYLQNNLDKVYNGVISNLSETNMFIQITEIYCDGAIRISEIEDDYLFLDKSRTKIIGKYSNNVYKMGDKIRVRVVSCDFEKRFVNLTFA